MALALMLLGMGLPVAIAGAFMFRLVFLPSRSGHVIATFGPDHPAARASAVLLLIGAALAVPGFLLFLAGPRPPVHPPGWKPPGPANFSG